MNKAPAAASGPSPPGQNQIQVAHGQVTGYQGTRFGGVMCAPATGEAGAWARIAIRHASGELTADLHEGDTLHLPGQTWHLSYIHATSRGWRATLTRTR